jgi:small acid-soluble spore protein F (minor alpha/beta-type SASP)
MSKNKTSVISENLREEIAKELGVFEQVKQDGGWQNVSSQKCGNIVTKAIEIANRSVENGK